MLLDPKEFVQLCYKKGVESHIFKGPFCQFTEVPELLCRILREGKLPYFITDKDVTFVQFQVLDSKKLPDDEDSIYSEAFKVLKIVAD